MWCGYLFAIQRGVLGWNGFGKHWKIVQSADVVNIYSNAAKNPNSWIHYSQYL